MHLVFFILSHGIPLFDCTEILENPTGHHIKLPFFVKTIYMLFPHHNQDLVLHLVLFRKNQKGINQK
jgi:hypothetical protein